MRAFRFIGAFLISFRPLPLCKRRGLFPSVRGRAAPDIRRCAMTLLELGMIARKHETDIAHAMLHAVAVCLSEGSWYGWE